MIGTAWAQGGGAAAAPSFIVQMAPLILVFVVFYFLLIRPQQQKQRQHKSMLDNLKRNDEVITAGGLYGTVVALAEQFVTLEIAPKVQVRVERQQISSLVRQHKNGGGEKEKGKKEKDK
jgi:preprotein translocase subunit YajC